jgi:type II restriction enzyme
MASHDTIGVTELVRHLATVPRDEGLRYVNPANDTEIIVRSVTMPYGPITYTRRPKGKHARTCKLETISEDIIRRVAAQIERHKAFSIDAILNGTGNNRSVLEAILAHAAEFFVCYPGKHLNGVAERRKHLYWNPDEPHRVGVIAEAKNILGVMTAADQSFTLTSQSHPASNFATLRTHQQLQVKLFEIGAAMNWSVWIAENDHNIKLGRRKLSSHPSAIQHLSRIPILQAYPNAQKAARHLDVMFVRDDGFIPAIIEIEHSTGILPGLTRMNTFRHNMGGVYANGGQGGTSFIICADDSKAAEASAKAASPQFSPISPRFLPYTRVDLLWELCRDNRQRAFNDNVFAVFSDSCR